MTTWALLSGCVAAPGALVNAGLGLATGAVGAGVSRAQGDCYANCQPGTSCNRETGMCDALPCAGACAPEETCEVTHISERCVPRAKAQLNLGDSPVPTAPTLVDPR